MIRNYLTLSLIYKEKTRKLSIMIEKYFFINLHNISQLDYNYPPIYLA